MRRSILMAICAVLAAMPSVAHANLVLAGGTQTTSSANPKSGTFTNSAILGSVQATGNNLQEVFVGPSAPPGAVSPGPCGAGCPAGWQVWGVAHRPTDSAPTLAALGWIGGTNPGGEVGIGFAPNQTGGGAGTITLTSLSIQLYNTANAPVGAPFTLGTSSGGVGPPIVFTGANVPPINGGPGLSGNAKHPFLFTLTIDEMSIYNFLLANSCSPGGAVGTGCNVGISASMPNGNGGEDDFFGFVATSAEIPTGPGGGLEPVTPPETVPEIPLPAAFPLFASGLGALGLLGWRRKRKSTASTLAA